MIRLPILLFLLGTMVSPSWSMPQAEKGQMDGYLGVPNQRVDESFDGGFSMYVAAWPLLETYPGSRFQTGLFGTWMHARLDDPKPEGRIYSDIEGGLGWWRDTRFATETPKFIMGGVALNFSAWANGPGAGKGRDWSKPQGKYGVAQLSPWILWPPDGLNLEQGTCGELVGYGYLPLPLTEPKSKTRGEDVPTGNHCWTLFLNTQNFKGPVAFFTPYFFSSPSVDRPELASLFLDSRPANPNRALQMETQYIPAVTAEGPRGRTFARIGITRFPVGPQNESLLVHRITSYEKEALWSSVERWFEGGPVASGKIDAARSHVHTLTGKGWSTWRIHTPETPKEERVQVAWNRLVSPILPDPHTFAYRWNDALVKTSKIGSSSLITLPEYWALEEANEKKTWVPRSAREIEVRKILEDVELNDRSDSPPEPYVTPDEGCWVDPGPVKGPFTVRLGDASVVTYSWYRFADQPALLNADLTDQERERLQSRVEKLHRRWTKDREYLPPNDRGELASLDPALIVEPPEGLEIGYVPIVTRQEAAR